MSSARSCSLKATSEESSSQVKFGLPDQQLLGQFLEDLCRETLNDRQFIKSLFSYRSASSDQFEQEGTVTEWQKFDFNLHFINVAWTRDVKDLVKFNSLSFFNNNEQNGMMGEADEWVTKTDVFGKYHLDRLYKKQATPKFEFEPLTRNQIDRIASQFSKTELHHSMRQLSDILREPDRMKYSVVIHFPVQFECLREAMGIKRQEFIRAMSASHRWYSSGGQTNTDFYKTDDGRFIGKCISALEFENFQQNAQGYFKYLFSCICSNKESFLSKVLAVVEMKVARDDKKYLMIMENITYGLRMNEFIRVFDLKGSKMNRFRKSENRTKTNLDTNFLLERNGDPIVVQMPTGVDFFEILERDVNFLRDKDIVDYSMLLVVHKQDHIVKVGIIDYLRKYDLKKRIEHNLKKIKNFGQDPTIVNPQQYSERFLQFMRTCIVAKHSSAEESAN